MGRDPEPDAGFAGIDWEFVVARIVTGTGWTLNHVLDELDLPSVSLLFDYWEYSPPAAEALATIERMLQSYFDLEQRPTIPTPAKPAKVVDLQSMPFVQQGAPIPWMSAEEYLRRKDLKEGNGNPS